MSAKILCILAYANSCKKVCVSPEVTKINIHHLTNTKTVVLFTPLLDIRHLCTPIPSEF